VATTAIDFNATREKLTRELGEAQEELASVESRLGGLTLDVELGAGSQADVDRAQAQQAQLTQRIAGLEAALTSLDDREAEHVAAEAEAKLSSDRLRLEALQKELGTIGARVVELVAELTAAAQEGTAAVTEAAAIARKHGINAGTARLWPSDAAEVISGRLHGILPGLAYVHPHRVEEIERRLVGTS
jgi:chromosome segregation ATPase